MPTALRRSFAAATALSLALAGAALAAAPASADTVTLNYDIDTTDPTAPRPDGSAEPCYASSGGSFHYRTTGLTVDTDGDYYALDQRNPGDGVIAIYSAEFDPADPDANCLAAYDDNSPDLNAVALTAGTQYYVLLTTFRQNATGSYEYTFTGPGVATFAPVTTATTTTLSVAPTRVTEGETSTLTAEVTGDSPTGEVEFFDAGLSLGTATVTDGEAALAVALGVGRHRITATYSGDSANETSTSTVSVLVVAPEAELAETGAPISGVGVLALSLLTLGGLLVLGRNRRLGVAHRG